MSNEKNEENLNSQIGEMDSEDAKIMEEIAESKETKEEVVETTSPETKVEAKVEPVVEPEVKAEVKETEEVKVETKTKTERTPTMIERWKHEVALKKQNKKSEETISKLTAELESLKGKSEKAVTKKEVGVSEDKIAEFAEKNNMKVDVLKGILDLVPHQEVDTSLADRLNKIEQEKVSNTQQAQFNSDFSKKEVSEIVDGYKLSTDEATELKRVLHDKAFTETYSKVPLEIILRGDSDFDRFRSPQSNAKGFEAGGKSVRGTGNVADKPVKEMTDKEFDQRLEEMEANQGKGGVEVQRDGRTIIA